MPEVAALKASLTGDSTSFDQSLATAGTSTDKFEALFKSMEAEIKSGFSNMTQASMAAAEAMKALAAVKPPDASEIGKAAEGVHGVRRALRMTEEALKSYVQSTVAAANAFDPKGAQVFSQTMDRMHDAIAEVEASLGAALRPALEAVANVVTGLADRFNGLDDATKKTIGTAVAVAAGIIGIVVVVGKAYETFELLSVGLKAFGVTSIASLGPVLLAIGAIAIVIAGVIVAVDAIKKHMEASGETMSGVFTKVWDGIKTGLAWVGDAFKTVFNAIGTAFTAPGGIILEGIAKIADALAKIGIGSGGDTARMMADAWKDAGAHLGDDLANGAAVAAQVMVAGGKAVGQAVADSAKDLGLDPSKLMQAGKDHKMSGTDSNSLAIAQAVAKEQQDAFKQIQEAERSWANEKLHLQEQADKAHIEAVKQAQALELEHAKERQATAQTGFENAMKGSGGSVGLDQAAKGGTAQQFQTALAQAQQALAMVRAAGVALDAMNAKAQAQSQKSIADAKTAFTQAQTSAQSAQAKYLNDAYMSQTQIASDVATMQDKGSTQAAKDAAAIDLSGIKDRLEQERKAADDAQKLVSQNGDAVVASQNRAADIQKNSDQEHQRSIVQAATDAAAILKAQQLHQMTMQDAGAKIATGLAGSGAGGLVNAAIGGATGKSDIGIATGGGAQGAIAGVLDQLLQQSQSLQGIIKIVSSLVQMLSNAVGSLVQVLGPIIQTLVNDLQPVIMAVGNVLGHLGGAFAGLGQIIELLSPMLTALANLVDSLAPVVELVYEAFLSQIIQPMAVLASVLAELAPAIQTLASGVGMVVGAIVQAWNSMNTAVGTFLAGIAAFLNKNGLGFLAGPVQALATSFNNMQVSTNNASAALASTTTALTAMEQAANSAASSANSNLASQYTSQQALQNQIAAAKAVLANSSSTSAQQAMAELVLQKAQLGMPQASANSSAATAQAAAAYAAQAVASYNAQKTAGTLDAGADVTSLLNEVQHGNAGQSQTAQAIITILEQSQAYQQAMAQGDTQAQALAAAAAQQGGQALYNAESSVAQSSQENASYLTAVAANTTATALNTQAMLSLTNGPQGFAAQAAVYTAITSNLNNLGAGIVSATSNSANRGQGTATVTGMGSAGNQWGLTGGATGITSSTSIQMAQDGIKLLGQTFKSGSVTLTQFGEATHRAGETFRNAVTGATSSLGNFTAAAENAAKKFAGTGSSGAFTLGSGAPVTLSNNSISNSKEGGGGFMARDIIIHVNSTGNAKTDVDGLIKEINKRITLHSGSRADIGRPSAYATER